MTLTESATHKPSALFLPLMPKGDGKKESLPDLEKGEWKRKLNSGRLRNLNNHPTFVGSQQSMIIKQLMAYASDAMLNVEEHIARNAETLDKFKTTDTNHQGGGTATNASPAAYRPSSLRGKMPLHFPNQLNDSRLSTLQHQCETIMGNANATHSTYQNQMAEYAKQIAELKLKGALSLQRDVYLRGILIISESLVTFAKTELEIDATTVTEYQLAILAIKKALMVHVPANHFEELDFLTAITKQKGADEQRNELVKFWKGVDNEGLTQPRSLVDDDSAEGLYEVNCLDVESKQSESDKTIVDYVAQKLSALIPAISTDLTKAKHKELRKKQDDATVKERFERQDIDNANANLAEAMEIDDTAERSVAEIAREEARKEASKKKKKARKKSSGDPKSHGSTPTESGINLRNKASEKKSKEKKSKKTKSKNEKSKNEKKRTSPEDGDEESSYDSSSRSRSRPRQKSALRDRSDRSKSPGRVSWKDSQSHNDQYHHRGRGWNHGGGRGRGRGRGQRGRSPYRQYRSYDGGDYHGGSHYGGRGSGRRNWY